MMQNRVGRRQSMDDTRPGDTLPVNSAGDQRPTKRQTFRVGVKEDKNRRCRRTMEDTHSFVYDFMNQPDDGYFAIFDGHAGKHAAEYCGSRFHLILADIIKRNPDRPITDLLDATFTYVDAAMEKMHFRNQGCTAATALLRWEDRRMAERTSQASENTPSAEALQTPKNVTHRQSEAHDIVPPATRMLRRNSQQTADTAGIEEDDAKQRPSTAQHDRRESVQSTSAVSMTSESAPNAPRSRLEARQVLYTANAGDARVVLSRSGKAMRLSYDHKGSDKQEGVRVQNAGGTILNNRVNGVLAVTRALGDSYMKDLVTAHPYTTETVLIPDEDEFLILACDGLWDVCTDQQAVELVREVYNPDEAARILVDHALREYSTDNLTVMVVRLQIPPLETTSSATSPQEDGGVHRESIAEEPADLQRELSSVSQAVSITSEVPSSARDRSGSVVSATSTTPNAVAAQDSATPVQLPPLASPARSATGGQLAGGGSPALQRVMSPRVAQAPEMGTVLEEEHHHRHA